MLSLYGIHLTNSSVLKKSSDLCIENIGGFVRDSWIARSNPLPRSIFVPGRLVAIPDYINMLLTSANCPVTVLGVRYSATQLFR